MITHGKPANYSSKKCRCKEACQPAWNAYIRGYRKRRKEAGRPVRGGPRGKSRTGRLSR
jgi:hypothetical protein